MRWKLGAVWGTAIGLACNLGTAFTCQDDAQCEGGTCQPIGACSFPDGTCASGQRYGEHSPDGLAGECVDAAGTDASSEGSTTPSPSTSTSTSTSGPPADGSSGPGPSETGTTTTDPSESSDSGEPLDPDLLLWIRFEDLPSNAPLDSSSYGFPSFCDDGQCPVPTDGPFGTAALFDGENDALEIPFAPPFEFAGPFTAALWTRIDLLDGNIRRMLFGHPYGASALNTWVLFLRPDLDEDPDWEIGMSMNAAGSGDYEVVDLPFELGQWVHVAGTYDEAGTMTVYIDGIPLISRPVAEPMFDEHSLTIGHDTNGGLPAGWFAGAIDEVRLYGRALDPAEIAALASR